MASISIAGAMATSPRRRQRPGRVSSDSAGRVQRIVAPRSGAIARGWLRGNVWAKTSWLGILRWGGCGAARGLAELPRARLRSIARASAAAAGRGSSPAPNSSVRRTIGAHRARRAAPKPPGAASARLRVNSHRGAAAPAHDGQKQPLGFNGQRVAGVFERRPQRAQLAGARFDRQRALAHRRRDLFGGENLGISCSSARRRSPATASRVPSA